PGSSLAVVGFSKFMRHSPFPKSAALFLSHRYILPGSHRYAARDDTAPQSARDWWHTLFLPRESPWGCRLGAQLPSLTGYAHRSSAAEIAVRSAEIRGKAHGREEGLLAAFGPRNTPEFLVPQREWA